MSITLHKSVHNITHCIGSIFSFRSPWGQELLVDTQEINEANVTPFHLFDMKGLQTKGAMVKRRSDRQCKIRNLKWHN